MVDIHDNEEITEYFPDDPLADVPDTTPNILICIKDKTTVLDKSRSRTKIKSATTSNESYIKCNICGFTFSNRSSLSLHQKTHKKQFECFTCHKAFNRKSNLVTHSRGHTNVKLFRCKYCSLSFTRTTELLKHAIFHTGDTRNQCRQCKLVLSNQERLERHKKTHVACANFQCHMCGVNGFGSKKNLSFHMRLHRTQFSHCSGLITAPKCTHNENKQLLQCELCKKQFSRRCNFMAHLKTHVGQNTPEKVKTHLCCICGKLFSYKTHLVRHLYIHTNVYKCEYCSKDFTQRGGLMQHIKKHQRDKQ